MNEASFQPPADPSVTGFTKTQVANRGGNLGRKEVGHDTRAASNAPDRKSQRCDARVVVAIRSKLIEWQERPLSVCTRSMRKMQNEG
jgi:hypothetical protein